MIADDVTALSNCPFIQLKVVADIPEFTRVSVKVKVVRVNEITTVTGGSAKQDVIVADSKQCMGLFDLVGRDGRDEFWNFILLSGCCNDEALWRSGLFVSSQEQFTC